MKKNHTIPLLLVAGFLFFSLKTKADTDKLPASVGWTKVDNLSSLSLGDYYFAFVDNEADLMLSLEQGYEQSTDANYKTMVYRTGKDAAMNPSMLWTLEAYDSGYLIRNAEYQDYFVQTEWNAAWYCRTHDNGGGSKDWGKWIIALADGKYTIQNGKYPDAGYVGPWKEGIFENGQEVAANKGESARGYFQIYAISKNSVDYQGKASATRPANFTYLIANPNAAYRGANGWEGSGTYTRNANVGFDGKGGFFEFCNWSASSWTGSISQTITGLPEGKYRVRAAGQLSATDVTLTLDVNGESVDFPANGTSNGTILQSGEETTEGNGVSGWQYKSVEVDVIDGQIQITISSSATAQYRWANVDNIELYYLGYEESGEGESEGTTQTFARAWKSTDIVSISDGILTNTLNVSNINNSTCSIAIKNDNNQFADITSDYYVFYPSQALLSMKGAKANAIVYAEQDYKENSADGIMGAYIATKATSADNKIVPLSFSASTSVIDVNISSLGVTATSVSLKANSGVSISGNVVFDIENGELSVATDGAATWTKGSTQSDVIRVVNIPNGAKSVRFNLLPVRLAGGVTITVEDANGNFYSKVFKDNLGSTTNAEYSVRGISNAHACKAFYKTIDFGAATEGYRSGNWMATVPSNVYFSQLSTPGSHDTCTKGSTFGIATECQKLTLEEQLAAGVRIFDIRPGYFYKETITADNLYIYHGQMSTGVKYVDAIKTLVEFVKANPTEAITVVMVKENSKPTLGGSSWTDRSSEMWTVLNACHSQYTAYMKLLDHSYYTLGDFRGKICYINRTGTECTNTTRITNWPDDGKVTDYSSNIGSVCFANIQDMYNTNGTNKQTVVKEMLSFSSTNTSEKKFHFNYTSSAGFPSSYANKTNPVIAEYLNGENVAGPTGYMLSDYIGCSDNSGKELLNSIIKQNYRYVFNGRSRNTK